MKHLLRAQVIANIELSDDEFNFILLSCRRHYDFTVRQDADIGGFLYGFKNRREFSDGEDKTLDLTFRQIDLLCKSLENGQEELSDTLYHDFRIILNRINDTTSELNNQLAT